MMGDIYRAGVLDEFAYAGGGRDLETVIVGNPFDAPKDEVDRAITDAMRNHHPGPSTNFTTRPDDSARPNYRITIVFNPPDNLSVHDLCGDVSGVRSEEPGASLRLVSIFCSHGDVMSYVYASTRAASTPRDPAVASVVANMMRELIPPVDPHATGANDLPI
jgi:hypothetical protein